MTNYYIDTVIWIDLYEWRKGFHDEPLGVYAMKLFSHIIDSGGRVIFSDLHITELGMKYSTEETIEIMSRVINNIEIVDSSLTQRNEAKRIAKELNIPEGDVLHALIAKSNECILITRDNHFKKLSNICE